MANCSASDRPAIGLLFPEELGGMELAPLPGSGGGGISPLPGRGGGGLRVLPGAGGPIGGGGRPMGGGGMPRGGGGSPWGGGGITPGGGRGGLKPDLFSSTYANRLEDLSVKADLNSSCPIDICLESSMFVIR